MQPPPRKQGNYLKSCKNLHSEQYSKLQAKNQQECDLLEDIRNFTKQRSAIEKSYGEALCKIAATYQNRKIACVPDIRLEDGSEAWNIYSVWRTVLDETEKLGKARLAAVEVFHQRISEDAKHTRHSKVNLGRKLTDNLQVVQKELQLQVQELDRHRRAYYAEEHFAHDAREKATDAETKLKRKKGSLFQSISSLQKNSAKFTAKKEQCDEKSAGARNDYLLSLTAANAQQKRYYEIDFERTLRTMEVDMYDKVSEYLSLMSRTELLTCSATQSSFNKIKEQAQTITRGYNIRCYLTFYPMLGHSIQYDFERCKGDQITKITAYDDITKETLYSEGKKYVARHHKECKIIKDATKKIQKMQTGHKNDAGEYHPDVETKLDDLRQVIRRAETSKLKIEAKLGVLKEGGIEIDDYQRYTDTDSMGTEIETPLSRTGSTLSVKEETTRSAEIEEDVDHETANKQYSVESVEAEREEYQERQKSLDTMNIDPTSVDWGDTPISPLPPVANGPQDEPAYPKCIVLYNYDAQNPDELTIVENEELELISEGDGDGWVQARNYKAEIGYVPQNYIEMEDVCVAPVEVNTVPDAYPQTTQDAGVTQSAYEEYQNGQMYNDQNVEEFSAVPPSDLPPPPPEVVLQNTEKHPQPLEINQTDDNSDSYCFAVYDYEATCEGELTFEECAVIRLISKTIHDIDDGWWKGSLDGVHGLFPSLVVEECRHDGQPFTPDTTSLSSPCTTPPPHTPPEVPGFLLPPEKVIITQPTPEVETVEEAIALQKSKKQDETQNDGAQAVSYYYETPNFEIELSGEQHQHYHRQFSSSPDSEATTERDQQYGELVSSPDVSNQEPIGRDIFNEKDNSITTSPDPMEDPQQEGKNGKVNKTPAPAVSVTVVAPTTEIKEEKSSNVTLTAAQIIVTAATPMVDVEERTVPLQEDSRVEADQQPEEDSRADSEDIDGDANFLEDDRPPPPPPAPEGGTASLMMKQEDNSFNSPPTESDPEPQKTVAPKLVESDSLDSNIPAAPKSPSPSDGPPDLDPEKLKSLDKIKESIA